MIKPSQVPTPVKIGVTAAMAAATFAGAKIPKDDSVKTGAKVVGTLATLAYVWWAFGGKRR